MRRTIWIALAVVIVDQLTKWAALKYFARHVEIPIASFLNLTLVYNRGAAFGFLNSASGWQNVFFIVVAVIACAMIGYFLYRLGPGDRKLGVGLSLILGGAIGNLIDRLYHGYVIDFIDFYYQSWHWPAFNVADSAITVGAAIIALTAVKT